MTTLASHRLRGSARWLEGTAVSIIRLQDIHIVARDLGRMAEFWQRALALTFRFRDADRWVQLKGGDSPFAIASAAEGVAAQAGAVPVFEVDDLESHGEAITGHGGRVISIRDIGDHGRVLTFSDPDGDVAQLLARPVRSA